MQEVFGFGTTVSQLTFYNYAQNSNGKTSFSLLSSDAASLSLPSPLSALLQQLNFPD